jgi:hypothetical protein
MTISRAASAERAAGHGVVRHERSHLALVHVNGAGNLQRRQHQTTGRVQHNVQGHVGIRQIDGAQDFFGIVDIDVLPETPENSWFPGDAPAE